jgi:hypothetical protein
MHITRNRKNKNLAIPADAAAIPPNPNSAAISAIIRKVTAQPNIVSPPLLQIESKQTNAVAVFPFEFVAAEISKSCEKAGSLVRARQRRRITI